MAVTLTSTGITFSDGTSQTSAASGGGLSNFQEFASSGTWNWASSGSPALVLVSAVGGGGAGSRGGTYNSGSPGGAGGALVKEPLLVTGNQSITVGGGGSASNGSGCGFQRFCWNAGTETRVGSLRAGGGGGAWVQGCYGECFAVRHSGSVGSVSVRIGNDGSIGTWGRGGNRGNQTFNFNQQAGGAGSSGGAVILW